MRHVPQFTDFRWQRGRLDVECANDEDVVEIVPVADAGLGGGIQLHAKLRDARVRPAYARCEDH
eukprot:3756191-Prymnesium_polylepis.1